MKWEECIEIWYDGLFKFFKNKGKNLRPWNKKWRDRRRKIIKKKCERCGATENLLLHHPYGKGNSFQVWDRILINLFEKSKYYKKRYNVKVCPKCEYQSFYKRKWKTPKYRCKKCYAVFDEPKIIETLLWEDDEYLEDKTKFVKENTKKITKQFYIRGIKLRNE